MKKVFLLAIMMIIFIGTSNAQQINWIKITEVEHQIKADGKDAKRVFIDCYTDWCGWCKRMDKDTFSDTTIAKIMNHFFYSVKYDAESNEEITFGGKTYVNPTPTGKRGAAHNLARMLLNNRLSYPSYSILNPDLTIATIVPGYYPAKDFEPIIVFMGGRYETKYSFEEFRNIYEAQIKQELMKEIDKKAKKRK